MQATGFKVTLTRDINAPRELVFRAWTEPARLAQWFGPAEVEVRELKADVRVGGAFRCHMVSPKGDHVALGKYTEIIPNARVRFTWQWESYAMPDSVVTIDLEDLGRTTRLTLVHEGLPDQEDAEQHTHGWSSTLDKFARLMDEGKNKA